MSNSHSFGTIQENAFVQRRFLGSGIRKNSEVGRNGSQTCGIQMSYDICYQPPTFIFKLDEALV
jgi:hypothetical protein